LVSSSNRVIHGVIVWFNRPWVVPAAIFRTVAVFIIAIVILLLEMYSGMAILIIAGLPIYIWSLFVFLAIWLLSLLDLLIFWVSNIYYLRQDGLEIRRGIIRLHSFVITPSGFADLSVFQGVGGRIFGYGDLTVTSAGERQTKLRFVRSPFNRADEIRDIMGKPIVRVESYV
jgi:membrane protein YdbS with pleckstrin-like domain